MGRPKGSRNKKNLSDELLEERKQDNKSENKKEKLNRILREINLKYKDPTMCKFAKDEPPKESLSFGIKELDDFLGGGAVFGNFVVWWGGEGVGKTTLALLQIAQAQKEGKNCVYIDMEHTLDVERAKIFGVNLEELVLIEDCETAEQAMDITIKLAKEKVVDLIVIDSIQAMSPKDEQFQGNIEKSMEKNNIALLARKMSEFLRRTASAVYKGKTAVILIGQARTGGIGSFAIRDVLTGGRAVKYYSMLTAHIHKGQAVDAPTISEKAEVIEINEEGDKVKKIKTIKRKIGFDCVLEIDKTKKINSKPELSKLHLPFYYETGFLKPKEA